MPKSVLYKTKIVDVSRVELQGKLEFKLNRDPDQLGAWWVGEDGLEEWLDKLDGKVVNLTITVLDGRDESYLFPTPVSPKGDDRE